VEEHATKAGVFTTKVNLSKRSDAFTLGDRGRILENVELEPVLVHVAYAEDARYPYEGIFRSIMKHLMDSATNEYLFAIDFLKVRTRATPLVLIFASQPIRHHTSPHPA
jgi:hypothetical protein